MPHLQGPQNQVLRSEIEEWLEAQSHRRHLHKTPETLTRHDHNNDVLTLHKQDTWFEKFLACDISEQNSVLPHADT